MKNQRVCVINIAHRMEKEVIDYEKTTLKKQKGLCVS